MVGAVDVMGRKAALAYGSGVTRLQGVGPAGKKLSGRAQLLPQGQCFTAAPLWSFPLVWADKALVTALSREAKTKSGPEKEGLWGWRQGHRLTEEVEKGWGHKRAEHIQQKPGLRRKWGAEELVAGEVLRGRQSQLPGL